MVWLGSKHLQYAFFFTLHWERETRHNNNKRFCLLLSAEVSRSVSSCSMCVGPWGQSKLRGQGGRGEIEG
jgi:hypothetical protein